MNKVLTPRRTHEAIITISSNNLKEFDEALENCFKEIKARLLTARSGGGFNLTNWNAEYIKTETSEKQYQSEWESFNKIRHTKEVHFCPECSKFSNDDRITL